LNIAWGSEAHGAAREEDEGGREGESAKRFDRFAAYAVAIDGPTGDLLRDDDGVPRRGRGENSGEIRRGESLPPSERVRECGARQPFPSREHGARL